MSPAPAAESVPSAYAGSGCREAAIVVFAKAPRAGLVKTRMTPPFESEQAAALYRAMLDDVLAATAGFAEQLDLRASVAVAPADACREIAQRVPRRLRVVAQRGRDLGERMGWAVAEAAAEGSSKILLRSSDSPMLGLDRVAAALEALDDFDLAVCPDLGGGYALIGLRGPAPGLFHHPMSTRSVLDDTLDGARRQGLRAHLLPPSPDLDTADDLAELARWREAGEPALCPATLAYLDRHGLWPGADSGS